MEEIEKVTIATIDTIEMNPPIKISISEKVHLILYKRLN